MGSPVAPLITPWKGEVGHAGGGPLVAGVAARSLDGATGIERRDHHRRRSGGRDETELGVRYPMHAASLAHRESPEPLPTGRPSFIRLTIHPTPATPVALRSGELPCRCRCLAPWAYLAPIVLLVCSNVFMTLAWYGHLNFKAKTADPGGAGVVGHRLHRVLPGGAGQPLRPRRLLGSRAQDHPGGGHARRVSAASSVLYLKEPLGWNPRHRLRADRRRRGVRLLGAGLSVL